MKTDGIFWLVSYPKSGNTWVRIFLHNYLLKSDKPININDIDKIAIASNRHLFDNIVGISSSDLTYDEIDILRPEYYKYYAMSESVPSLNGMKFLKVHDAYIRNGENRPIFPLEITRGIIYIVRNPYDVVVSTASHFDVDIDKAVNYLTSSNFSLAHFSNVMQDQFRQQVLNWKQHFHSWNNVTKVPKILLKYEELLEDPITNFTALVEFLPIELDKEHVKQSTQFSSFQVLKSQEEDEGFSEVGNSQIKFFNRGTLGHGKKLLSEKQVEKIRDAFLPDMRSLGYEI